MVKPKEKKINEFPRLILLTFLEESGINDRVAMGDKKAKQLEYIMRTRFAKHTIEQQAAELFLDESTINRYIRELKALYDETQKYSLILPPRREDTEWEQENMEHVEGEE